MSVLYLYDAEARTLAETLTQERHSATVFVELGEHLEATLQDITQRYAGAHWVVSGSKTTLSIVLNWAYRHDITIGILPLASQSAFVRMLALPKDPHEAWAIVSRPSERKADLLLCNDMPVLGDVRIGEQSIIRTYEFAPSPIEGSGRLRRLIRAWRERRHLRHHRFEIALDKEEAVHVSAIGLIALKHNNQSAIARVLNRTLGARDGQLTLLLLAPTSLFEFYVAYPVRMVWYSLSGKGALPRTWGHIKTPWVRISSSEDLEAHIDDVRTSTLPVTLEVAPEAVALSTGEAFWEEHDAPRTQRNTQRLAGVPHGDDDRMSYFQKALPLFRHASQGEYAELFGALRDETRLNWTYVILLLLSTVLSTLGLFINSASVIIGAMLLAPLMQPIVGLSMGVLRQDEGLLQNGIRSIGVGVLVALGASAAIAGATPIDVLGSEMAARLNPTLLDLFVAIASGVAAAYAKNNQRISGSLVGVAIAVALVPPLSVAGIGVGWGNMTMFLNAFLLFVTNLVGIVLSAAITFFVLGYSPIHLAKKGLLIWVGIVIAIAAPLSQSFERMRQDAAVVRALSHVRFDYGGQRIAIDRVEYLSHRTPPQVRCEVILDRPLDKSVRRYLVSMIQQAVGTEAEIVIAPIYRLSRP
jgi:uncharacterized hydrophobic protein (TIGR00271 family)